LCGKVLREGSLKRPMTKTKSNWTGPFKISDLLDREERPPEDLGVYLVSRMPWKGEPEPECIPLYVGGTTGKTPRFPSRVGELIADMTGFGTVTAIIREDRPSTDGA
jgi:hypothetical protein